MFPSSFIWCATNVTISRLILNIRREGEKHRLTDIDTDENLTRTSRIPESPSEETPSSIIVEHQRSGVHGYATEEIEYYELRMHWRGS